MKLNEIYKPIAAELQKAEEVFAATLGETKNEAILKVNRFLLETPGKRLRPALVIFSAKVTAGSHPLAENNDLSNIASALELIHLASVIHDDIIDHATWRHHRPTVNSRWGNDVAIALGDYLYAQAFKLAAECRNPDLIHCLSAATKDMCEGELSQVCERDNMRLLKRKYRLMIRKKTASLFAASCQAGAMTGDQPVSLQQILKRYGLNFGMAFQIVDDCLDLIAGKKQLGKDPGADFNMGELTLPMLNLLAEDGHRERIGQLLAEKENKKAAFEEIRQRFLDSPAFHKTKAEVSWYIDQAKKNLLELQDSYSKQSLFALADHLTGRLEHN